MALGVPQLFAEGRNLTKKCSTFPLDQQEPERCLIHSAVCLTYS
jgi:hypothetical protein